MDVKRSNAKRENAALEWTEKAANADSGIPSRDT